MQPLNSSSLNSSHDLVGHQGPAQHADPYGDHQTPSPYNNFWPHATSGAATGGGNIGNDLTRSPSSSTSLVMQVKASNVSPPGGSPQGTPTSTASAAAAAAAAAAGHSTAMSHQSYPTYHHHNPYYPGYPGMDLAYFGGSQQYNMANSAFMGRPDLYDAEAGRYHQLL